MPSRASGILLFERGGEAPRKAQEFMEELKLARAENHLCVAEFNGWSPGGDLPWLESFR